MEQQQIILYQKGFFVRALLKYTVYFDGISVGPLGIGDSLIISTREGYHFLSFSVNGKEDRRFLLNTWNKGPKNYIRVVLGAVGKVDIKDGSEEEAVNNSRWLTMLCRSFATFTLFLFLFAVIFPDNIKTGENDGGLLCIIGSICAIINFCQMIANAVTKRQNKKAVIRTSLSILTFLIGLGATFHLYLVWTAAKEMLLVLLFLLMWNFIQSKTELTSEDNVQHENERAAPTAPANSSKKHQKIDTAQAVQIDELLPMAVDAVLKTGQASASMLQRRLKLNYSRAARLIDQMEEQGYVGPFEGSRPRQILITVDQWTRIREKVCQFIYNQNTHTQARQKIDTEQLIRDEEDWRREQSSLSPLEYELQKIDSMDGHTFEYWCADLLKRLGYANVSVTPASGDQGVDVLAEKEGIKYAVQCKRYESDLGNTPVQEVTAGHNFYRCQVGAVMTNRYFTVSAKELAEANGILLWDRDWIIEKLTSINEPAQGESETKGA